MVVTRRGAACTSPGVWFNPAVRARRPSRRALGAAVVVVLGAGGTSFALATARDSSGAPVVVPRFVEETATAGLDHRYEGGYEHFVGGGVAAFD